jgi:MYXO-CTERM domain-containing protein
VAVSSRDRAENFSQPTLREQAVSIQDSTDFWENYQSAGGAESGGCGCRADGSGQPASLLVLLVGLGGLMVRRRR